MGQLSNRAQVLSSRIQNLTPVLPRTVTRVLRANSEEVRVAPIQQPLNSLVYTERFDNMGMVYRDYFLVLEHALDYSKLYPLSDVAMVTPNQRVYAEHDWDKAYIGPHLLGGVYGPCDLQFVELPNYAPMSGRIDRRSILLSDVGLRSKQNDTFIPVPESNKNAVNIRFGSWLFFDAKLDFLEDDYTLATSAVFDVVIFVSPLDLMKRSLEGKKYLQDEPGLRYIHIKPSKNVKYQEHKIAKMVSLTIACAFASRGLKVSIIMDELLHDEDPVITLGGEQYRSPFKHIDITEYFGCYSEGSVTGFLNTSLKTHIVT